MRTILLAAFVAVAATQLAPAANAACAESHGGTAHVHSGQCGPASTFFFECPLPAFEVKTPAGTVGFACD